MRYAVVIPVYNEKDLLPRLLQRLERTPVPRLPEEVPNAPGALRAGETAVPESGERIVILVDDGSTDGSREIVEERQGRAGPWGSYETISQGRNLGKGAAVRAGFKRALELRCDLVLIHDADLEYDPADHAALLRPILDGRADVVIGSRFIGGAHRVLYFWHSAANRAITLMSNVCTNLNLTDIECCLKAFTREVLERIEIREDRFGVEPELVAKVARLKLPPLPSPLPSPLPPARPPAQTGLRPTRIFEVPVSYAGRTYAEGKKITWRDGFNAVGCIVKYNLLS